MTETKTRETHSFETEVKQLLNLVIHSLYSNKDIFLRELISNASDACDKLRYESLQDKSLLEDDPDLNVRVTWDPEARTVTVSDNGIGMSRDEVVENIGTIAHSGTRRFLEAMNEQQKSASELIGQFGVGFYSSFVVADRVTLLTRKAGSEEGVCWESEGQGEYTIESVDKTDRGTDVVLHLAEGEDEFLDRWRLRSIIQRYSDHINLPILMPKEKGEDEAADAEPEMEKVNQASALWTRPKNEITDEEYESFYQHIAHDPEPPLAWTHNKVEGRQEYTSLLYIPSRAPFDLWDRDSRRGIRLYVRRVFIMDDADQLMPAYLRFVRGVVDSADLPLNVSREILQSNRSVDGIRNGSVRKVLDLLKSMAANEPDKYATFWRHFGRVLKEGPGEDPTNRERIAELFRFTSTNTESDDETVSLRDYIDRMRPGQDRIYYITADSLAAAKNSPHLEIFRRKGVEVLLLHDQVDEWLVAHLHEFDGKHLQSVAQGDLDLSGIEGDDTEAEEADAENEKELAPLLESVKKALGDRVADVRFSRRLTESPACLVAEQDGISLNLERLLKAAGQNVPDIRPILELNPSNPLVKQLDGRSGEELSEWSHLLFDQAMLAEGGQLEDPGSFVRRMNHLLVDRQQSG